MRNKKLSFVVGERALPLVVILLLAAKLAFSQTTTTAPVNIRTSTAPFSSPSGNLTAITITIAWDANPQTDNVTGYIIFIGTAPGDYSQMVDVGNVTSYIASGQDGIRYYISALAYRADGARSSLSPEISVLPTQEARCLSGGSQAIAINPTKFVKTGAGGAGDLAEVYFLIQSVPAVTYLSLKANGLEFQDSIMNVTGSDSNLKPSLGLRFRMPPAKGTYPISVLAKNSANCFTEKLSAFSFTIR